MEPLSAENIQRRLPARTFGRAVHYFDRIGSTNTELKRLAEQGAPEGTLLVADEQLAGRGRFERRWHAPPGCCLLASLLFRPGRFGLPAGQAQQVTMVCALAAVEAVAEVTGLAVGLKWPNDLVYQDRKLAGLLTELGFAAETLDWVVVGLGLNVNLDFASESGPPLSETAASLQTILGRPVSRLALLRAYLVRVEEGYEALRAGHSPHPAWAGKLTTLGRQVTVSGPGQTLHGLAEAVDEDGALLLRLADGSLRRVLAGDVTLRG